MYKVPKVQVLMSTYNGENYLIQQVESILNQKNVDVHLLIRDDGSTDDSINVIQKLKKTYNTKIEYYKGKNVGYKKSFLDLAKKTSENFDFFAFADQDDYWLPKKLDSAINHLVSSSNSIQLYASTVIIADEKLKPLYKKDISNFVNSFGSSLSRIRLAGCTYVFNKKALRILNKFDWSHIPNKKMPSHDGLLMTICQAVNGYVYVDQEAYLLHRRRTESVTSGGNGILRRINNERKLMFLYKNDRSILASRIYDTFKTQISPLNKKLISEIINYNKSLSQRLKLAKNKQLDCGLKLGNLETKIRIMTGYF